MSQGNGGSSVNNEHESPFLSGIFPISLDLLILIFYPISRKIGWLVVFGLNDPLPWYFSLYRVVSQREGESKEIG